MSRKPELKGRAARLARLIPVGGGSGAARTPFVLLVVLLLSGGLIGLLVLNSALSEGAFQLDDLQRQNKSLTDEGQALQRDVDGYSAPDALQRRAHELGMVPGGDPAFLNPDGTVKGVPSPAAAQPAENTAEAAPPPEALSPALNPPMVLAPTLNAAGTPGASPDTSASGNVRVPLSSPLSSPATSRSPAASPRTADRPPAASPRTAPSSTPSARPSTTPGR
ncbi:septum formation initiator family protein [Streptomyces sp. NPDC047022]|uniref:septum formation initiator family protein n=1 Tax=Streptomyces sp. NPDC047022 TaxID=3155737 RepID=UPI0033F29AD4